MRDHEEASMLDAFGNRFCLHSFRSQQIVFRFITVTSSARPAQSHLGISGHRTVLELV